ncbi:hypothetical protein EP7_001331 [Isosphaeraceae bacterium EP7]
MRILDGERSRALLKAYLITIISLVGSYVVIDATTNLDEFLRIEDGNLGLFLRIGQFYCVRLGDLIVRLSGVAIIMSAVAVFVVRPMVKI